MSADLTAFDLERTRVVLEQILALPLELDVEDSYYNSVFESTIAPLITVAIERLRDHEDVLVAERFEARQLKAKGV